MVGARNRSVRSSKINAANFRAEQSRAAVPQAGECAESMHIAQGCAHQGAINFRFSKLNRKVERSIQDGIEIESAVSELPEIFRLNAEPSAQLLFQSGVELVAAGRSQGLNVSST